MACTMEIRCNLWVCANDVNATTMSIEMIRMLVIATRDSAIIVCTIHMDLIVRNVKWDTMEMLWHMIVKVNPKKTLITNYLIKNDIINLII